MNSHNHLYGFEWGHALVRMNCVAIICFTLHRCEGLVSKHFTVKSISVLFGTWQITFALKREKTNQYFTCGDRQTSMLLEQRTWKYVLRETNTFWGRQWSTLTGLKSSRTLLLSWKWMGRDPHRNTMNNFHNLVRSHLYLSPPTRQTIRDNWKRFFG